MEIRAFDNKYKYEVIKCLQRNFEWMSKISLEEIEEWFSPIVSYNWGIKEVSKEEYPYNHGAVIFEQNQIVGFFGMIALKKDDNIWVSTTTWAIDKDYRGVFFEVLNKIIIDNVNYFEITPLESVARILEKYYGFSKLGNFEYRMLPVPCELDNTYCNWVKEKDIEDLNWKNDYLNHANFYGVSFVNVIEKETDNQCKIFYKKYDENSCRIKILKIDNPYLFSKNAHEISWKIVRKEFYSDFDSITSVINIMDKMYSNIKVCIECDDLLLGNNKLSHPLVKQAKVSRLVKTKVNAKIDFMYTEYALLSNHI